MSLNLIALIKAGGSSGASGQTFKNDVPGAAAGVRMTDYRISEVSFSGEPLPDIVGGYNSGDTFNIVATFTRGSQAYRIQRNLSSAWTVSTLDSDLISSRASITSFSSSGSPSGATHSLNVQVTGSKSGTVTDAASGSQDTSGLDTDPWPINQYSITFGGGSGGQSEIELVLQYNPDSAAFNPVLDNLDSFGAGWKFMMDRSSYSASDFDIEWHGNSSFTDLVITGATLPGHLLDSYYPTSMDGLMPGESLTMYVRYRPVSGGAWTKYNTSGAVVVNDPREPI